MMDPAPAAPVPEEDVTPGAPALAGDAGPTQEREESIKQTIIVVVVALIVAFIFRAFVIEPFVIPTGSMAPTLLGAHTRQHSYASGHGWTINTWDRVPEKIDDPITGLSIGAPRTRVHPGDRILVFKYIYALLEPQRWDVVVFKNPEQVGENFIKRLIGLPFEQVRLVDGDVFTRRVDASGASADGSAGSWTIQRKPRRVQEAVWHTIFSSEYVPLPEIAPRWTGPWVGRGWERAGGAYHFTGGGQAHLQWDTSARDADGDRRWPIDDWTPYNDDPTESYRRSRFPIADLRMRAGVRPRDPGLSVTAEIEARGHQFRGRIEPDGRATLAMRPAASEDGADPPWRILAETETDPLAPGEVANLAFIHVDQALEIRRDGRLIARAEYDWGPDERLDHALLPSAMSRGDMAITDPTHYTRASVRWAFEGVGPDAEAPALSLHRVGLDRDLFYQPALSYSTPGRASEGPFPLRDGQFFVVGDNSAASRDSRLWDKVDSWLGRAVDPPAGVVPREMMVGKAFFVYFPAPHDSLRGVPAPDLGRMRFIR